MTAKLRRCLCMTLGIGGSIVVFGGCANESGAGNGISIQNFPAAFADALCNNIGRCCRLEGYVHDAASCRAKTEAVLGLEAGRAQAKGTPFDPNGARACIETVAALARSCSADNTEALVNAACIRVYAGNQPEGATCTSGFQCASGDCVTSFERPARTTACEVAPAFGATLAAA